MGRPTQRDDLHALGGDRRYHRQISFVTTSAGAADEGKPVLLDSDGNVDATVLNAADIDLSNLGDVVVTSIADNELVAWNSGTAKWINQTAAEAGLAASSHTHAASAITSGTLTIVRGGTGAGTKTAAFDNLGPGTTKGDLIVHNGTDHVREAIGTDGFVLAADSAQASGVKWSASGASGEVNTASNQGVGGVGLFKQKTGVDLELRNINAGSSKITVTLDAGNNEVDIDVAQANLVLTESQISDLTHTTVTAASSKIAIAGTARAPTVDVAEANLSLANLGTRVLANLSDVVVTSVADNEVLAYNSGSVKWINQTAAEAGLSVTGHTHTEVDISDLSHFSPSTLDADYGVETITSLLTFDRNPSAPFAVTASSAVVPNLDADLLDGSHATAFAASSHTHAETDITDLNHTTIAAGSSKIVVAGTARDPTVDLGTVNLSDLNIKTISQLDNVAVTSVGDNEVLAYDLASDTWINQTPSEVGLVASVTAGSAKISIGGTSADPTVDIGTLNLSALNIKKLGNLDNVNITSVVEDEVLAFVTSGSLWRNRTHAEVGISSVGHTHTEVDVTDLNHTTISAASSKIAIAGTARAPTVDVAEANLSLANLGTRAIANLSDVVVTTVADNELMAYDSGSGNWINQTAAEAALAAASHTHVEADVTDLTHRFRKIVITNVAAKVGNDIDVTYQVQDDSGTNISESWVFEAYWSSTSGGGTITPTAGDDITDGGAGTKIDSFQVGGVTYAAIFLTDGTGGAVVTFTRTGTGTRYARGFLYGILEDAGSAVTH